MSFGEASNRFFWAHSYWWEDYEFYYQIHPNDSFKMYCMGGEL